MENENIHAEWDLYLNQKKKNENTDKNIEIITNILKKSLNNTDFHFTIVSYLSAITIEALTLKNRDLLDILIIIYNKSNIASRNKDNFINTLKNNKFNNHENICDKDKIIEAIITNKNKIINLIDIFNVYAPNKYKNNIENDNNNNISEHITNILKYINKYYIEETDSLINYLYLEKNTYKYYNDNNYDNYKKYINEFINKLVTEDYKFDNNTLYILYHCDEFKYLEKNNVINSDFLEKCYENFIMTTNLLTIKKYKWNKSTIKLIEDKIYNKSQEEYIKNNIKWYEKLEFFLEKKVLPTKKLFNNICNFLRDFIHEDTSGYYKKASENIRDVTDFVNLLVNYGYHFTTDDIIILTQNYLIITNIEDYNIDLENKDLSNAIKEANYNPYNIKIGYTNNNLEEKCKTKLTLHEIKNILNENKKLKLNQKCFENLCKSSDYSTIKSIMKLYKLKPNMKCIMNAIEGECGKLCITELFKIVYNDYIENKPDINKPDINKPDINKPDINKPDINKPDINKPDINKPDINKPIEVKLVKKLKKT
jgi:hypothetical protein